MAAVTISAMRVTLSESSQPRLKMFKPRGACSTAKSMASTHSSESRYDLACRPLPSTCRRVGSRRNLWMKSPMTVRPRLRTLGPTTLAKRKIQQSMPNRC